MADPVSSTASSSSAIVESKPNFKIVGNRLFFGEKIPDIDALERVIQATNDAFVIHIKNPLWGKPAFDNFCSLLQREGPSHFKGLRIQSGNHGLVTELIKTGAFKRCEELELNEKQFGCMGDETIAYIVEKVDLTYLKHFYLSSELGITDQGIQNLANALAEQHASLESLEFCANAGIQRGFEALIEAGVLNSLQNLNVGISFGLEKLLAVRLASSPPFTCLKLAHCSDELLVQLTKGASLDVLDLSNSTCSNEGFKIAIEHRAFDHLQHLSLYRTIEVGDEGITELANVFSISENFLKTFTLFHTRIGLGLINLAKSGGMRDLSCFYLNIAPFVTNKAIEEFAKSKSQSDIPLKSFHLLNCRELTEDAADSLTTHEILREVTSLSIGFDNKLTDLAVEKLFQTINIGKLKHLRLDGSLTKDQLQHIVSLLIENKTSLRTLQIHTSKCCTDKDMHIAFMALAKAGVLQNIRNISLPKYKYEPLRSPRLEGEVDHELSDLLEALDESGLHLRELFINEQWAPTLRDRGVTPYVANLLLGMRDIVNSIAYGTSFVI